MTTQITILEDERNIQNGTRIDDRCVIQLPCGKYRVRREAGTDFIISVEVERQRKNGKNVWGHLCDHAHHRRVGLAVHFATTKVWA